jgi:endoglucanase
MRLLRLLIVACYCFAFNLAKSNPTQPISRALLFQRAASLDNGVSISWLEQTWNTDLLQQIPVKNTDFALLKRLGFKSIRLPVAFSYFDSMQISRGEVFARIDEIVKQCKAFGFKLIIDNHYGNLNDSNYQTETPRIINLWLNVAKRYQKESNNFLFFEIYNEPPRMNPQAWKDVAYNIVTAIHKSYPQRTLIVGASNYNSIFELSRFVRLADENVIYTFHFYEPFLFTHQGAEWIGNDVATVGVPFPYTVEKFPQLNFKTKGTSGEYNYNKYKQDGNVQSIFEKMRMIKKWSDKYYVPLLCGEYGVYNKYADLDSRCNYIKAVREALKSVKIPGILWDYNANFSIFTGPPSVANLPYCMRNAIGFKQK